MSSSPADKLFLQEWARWNEENQFGVEHVIGDFRAWFERQRPVMETLHSGLQKLGQSIEEAAAQFRVAYDERMMLYPKLQARVIPLAKRGWFLSGAMGLSDLLALAEVCDSASDAELDTYVAALYRDDIMNQMSDILRTYPHRGFALEPSLKAHQRGEYALSVPVFFAQSDGICFEGMKRYVFLNRPGEAVREVAKEELLALDATNPNTLTLLRELMWLPLAESLPVGYSSKDRDKYGYAGLNRNTVLHGLALTEYATEENSLKAFSMLSYIASLMSQVGECSSGPVLTSSGSS